MPLVSYYPASTYVGGANMGDANMGGLLGDAWNYVKKNPLVLVPPLYVGQKTLQAVPTIIRSARTEVQATLSPFRPAPPPSQVDAITSALTGTTPGSSSSSSSMLPIILGAGALGLVLILALGKRKKKS